MSAAREQWTSPSGFVLASVGGAVGIGNIWRFSYVAGENGGAAFLFVYLACVVLIGIPLMIAELTIGRHAQGDAISSFEIHRKPSRWNLVGWLGVIAACLLLSYYAVIAGWRSNISSAPRLAHSGAPLPPIMAAISGSSFPIVPSRWRGRPSHSR